MKIKSLLEQQSSLFQENLQLSGWIRTARKQKKVVFIELGDGSTTTFLQLVIDPTLPSYLTIESEIKTGASICVEGTLVKSPGSGQSIELHVQSIELLGKCPDEFPLQKKEHTLEFLREIAHLRPRTRFQIAVQRIRSTLAQATHSFFASRNFCYVHTPIITASDCEGAGELFRVTTLPPKNCDSSLDFFGKMAYLTVSGQLNGEAMAMGLGDIYTFGPTFRAENSNTSRHLAEFWMIEPEMAFADLYDNMECAESYIKSLITTVLENCSHELAYLDEIQEKGLIARLSNIASHPFARVTYTEAVEILQKSGKEFAFPVHFGSDLQSEHERYLAEHHFQKPTIVYNYPRKIKSFYMRDNEDGTTVAAMDILVPGIGELVGGSQREERIDKLEAKIIEFGLNPKDYSWYLDLRRYGSVVHSGFGLGFERMVQFVTGTENIRDVIAFPRYPGHAEF